MMMVEKPDPLASQHISHNHSHPTPETWPREASSSSRAPDVIDTAEEEPYTINCICKYTIDDGNTVQCDSCEAWQHIGCFYPDNPTEVLRNESFKHKCSVCEPRPLDKQRAISRMRKFRKRAGDDDDEETSAPADKKTKRTMSKSNKKKPKTTELYRNSAEDHPHPAKDTTHSHKKSKSTHKLPTPVTVTVPPPAKRSPSYGKPPSPASTPPDATTEFKSMRFSEDIDATMLTEDDSDRPGNGYHDADIFKLLKNWISDHEAFAVATGQSWDDVIRLAPAQGLRPSPNAAVVARPTKVGANQAPQHILTCQGDIPIDTPVMELSGTVAMQETYFNAPENKWGIYHTPLPRVFLHPQIPLCIDARSQGSDARNVQRSCRPNLDLKTYLQGTRLRFWLTTSKACRQGDELTLPWDFRLPGDDTKRVNQLLGLNGEEALTGSSFDVKASEFAERSRWIGYVLGEHGGCACKLGDECAFKRFFKTFQKHVSGGSSMTPPNRSRATSLAKRKTPSKSKSPITEHHEPAKHSPTRPLTSGLDATGILTEPTDRDKRKVAMVEDSFRRMEQQPPKKKKRVSSDGSQGASKAKSKEVSGYTDAGTMSGKSPTPAAEGSRSDSSAKSSASSSPTSVTRVRKATYVDATTQTDPGPDDLYIPPKNPTHPPRRVVSLAERLLRSKNQQLRAEAEEKARRAKEQEQAKKEEDVETKIDIKPSSAILAAVSTDSAELVSPKTTVAPLPISEATVAPKTEAVVSTPAVEIKKDEEVEDQVMTDAPIVTIKREDSPVVPIATSAPSATESSGSGPVSAVAAPIIPKKKLSLSDYRKRSGAKGPSKLAAAEETGDEAA